MTSLIEHIALKCPFYREQITPHSKWDEIPIISKTTIKSRIRDFVAAPGAIGDKLADVLSARKDARIRGDSEFPFKNNIIIEQTSGTSGIPLRLAKTKAERMMLLLSMLKCRSNIDPEIRYSNFVPLLHRSWNSPLDIDIYDTSKEGVHRLRMWLTSKNARWIHTSPLFLQKHIASGAGELRFINDGLRFIETTGMPVPDGIQTAFISQDRIRLVNQYGSREIWGIGYARFRDPFTIGPTSIVEIVDDFYRPITDAGREGSIVISSKVLRLMPIVRYRTGDRGKWTDIECGGKMVRALVLCEDRDLNMMLYSGKWISGTAMFRVIISSLYKRYGYPVLDYVQIVKVGANEFQFVVIDNKEGLRLAQAFSDVLSNDNPSNIVSNVFLTAAEAKDRMLEKPYLFINVYDRR